MTIPLPSITVPKGCESQAANFLRGIRELAMFTGRSEVVPDPAMRTVSTSFEHCIDQAIKELEASQPEPAMGA